MAKTRTPDRSYRLPEWLGICIICGRNTEQTSFGAGRAGECNTCAKLRWNANNQLKVRAQRLYGNAQKRAKANGWPPPNFDSLWIEERIRAGVCEVTGIPFDLTTTTSASTHAKNPWVPSLDRIDSAKPYVKDNVQVVVYMYNVCKSEFAHRDVATFCKAVVTMEIEIG
jgi:hypothetical protein